jgi:di/tricarboxylate transporter
VRDRRRVLRPDRGRDRRLRRCRADGVDRRDHPAFCRRALEPKVLGLLAGSIGLGAFVVESGLADVISSFTLINPFSHQSNVMVMQPGGYTGAQFARFGAPSLAACLVTVCGLAHLLLRS